MRSILIDLVKKNIPSLYILGNKDKHSYADQNAKILLFHKIFTRKMDTEM